MKHLYLLSIAFWCVVATSSAQITVFPHIENFDSYTSNGPYQCASTVTLNNGWLNETSTTEGASNGDWSNYSWSTPTVGTGPTSDHTGNGGYFLFTSSFSCFNSYRHLRSPTFDFTNLSHPKLNFWSFIYGSDIGQMTIEASTDGGTTWSEVFFDATESQGNFWKEVNINLCAYGNQSSVILRFVALTGSTRYSDFAIDDFSISNNPPTSCEAVSAIRTISTTATTAVVQWPDQCAATYNWEVVPFGNAQGNGVLQSGTTANTNVALTGLNPVTAYHFYIKTFCTTDSSNYAGPFLFSSNCNGALNGTYQIGGNTPNFITLTDAVNSLKNCGVGGPVVFDIAPDIYKENLIIPIITGASSTNTITFRGQDLATTIIEHDSLSLIPQNSTIQLDEAQYIILKRLTISNTDNITDAWGIHFFDDAQNNLIDSCLILLDTVYNQTGANLYSTGIIASHLNGSHSNNSKRNASNTIIQNTQFIGGTEAVSFLGYSATLTNRNTNNQVLNCHINGVYNTGISLNFQESPVISANTITFSTSTEGTGVSMSFSKEATITRNLIINAPNNGISLYSSNTSNMNPVNAINVSNNMVTAVNQGFSITLFSNEMVDVYHNTFYTDEYVFVSSGDHSTDNIKNNIFASSGGNPTMMILNGTLLANSSAFDYNIYYHPSNVNIAKIGTVIYPDLASWNTYTPSNNSNSIVGNPLFNSVNDLHLQGTIADSAALIIPSITIDFDGDARDAQFPDIGADEYIAASCLPPADLNANSITGVSSILNWISSGAPISSEIEYGLAGFTLGNGTSIFVSDSIFSLTGLTQNTNYTYRVRSICSAGDTSLWSDLYPFLTECDVNTPTVLPFLEDFENTTNITIIGNGMAHCATSSSWKIETSSPNGRMRLGTNSPVNNGGTGALLMDCSVSNSLINNAAILTLNMSNYINSDNLELSFDIRSFNSVTTSSENKIWIRGSSSDNWVEIYDWRAINPTTFQTINHLDIDKNLSNAGQTVSATFQIRLGQADRFQYPSVGAVFDNIKIDTVACSQPLALGTTYINPTAADLVWSDGGSATSWEVEWGLVNFSVGNGNRVSNLTDTTLSISGLLKDREYDFYVRANCGTNSNWAGPYSFKTLCDAISFFPYSENFSLGNNTVNCWRTEAEEGLTSWVFDNNNGQNFNNTPMAHFNDALQGYGNENKAVLYSPLFNTQGLDTAFMSFTYNFNSNENNDYFRVEVWDGVNWNTVFNVNTDDCGLWYNCTYNTAQIDLTPYINPELRVKFIYDDGVQLFGTALHAAIDDFVINGFYMNDVSVTSGTANFCSTAETVTVNFINNGINTLTSIPLSYVANSAAPVTETWTGSLASGMTGQYTFSTTFDASSPIQYNISAYSSLPMDGNLSNDLATWLVDGTPNYTVPMTENFNSFTSTDWTTSATISQGGHGMPSASAWINLFNLFKKVEIETPRIGIISAGDELRFNYRYVDFPNGTVPTQLGNGDTLTVQVSTDCGLTYTTIGQRHAGNHTSTTNYTGVNYDLSAFVGKAIIVKITAERKFSGDYFFDLDDVYIGSTISVGATITSNYNGFDISCINASDGSATATSTGIAMPITASWSSGETTTTASNLSPGQNFVTITDANGFDFTYDFVMNAPDLPTTTIAITSDYNGTAISCNEGSDGAATVTASGGISGYTYLWSSNAANQTTNPAINLPADTFTVIVSDGNGCQVSDTIILTDPTAILPTLSSQPDIDSLGVGSVKATAQGGTPPYSYLWDANANSATTDSVSNLGVGNYTVTITDANGCSVTDTVNIDFLSPTSRISEVVSILKITPNPTRANVSIQLALTETTYVDLKIYNINGQLVQDLGQRNLLNETIQTDLSNFPNGVYLVRIRIDGAVITRRLVLSK